MDQRLEDAITQVVLDRRFQIRIDEFAPQQVLVTITDEHDPRLGCAQLRGESAAGPGEPHRRVADALLDACTQALSDEYAQATACGRCVKKIGREWTTCVLGKVHDGPCRDEHGNVERAYEPKEAPAT